MWKKPETAPEPEIKPSPAAQPEPRPTPPPKRPAPSPQQAAATIGSSISIKGDISGDEDLLIEGRVEGAIELRKHNVTVGSNGRVEADIHGKRICIAGEVTGDLFGDEILIRQSGKVTGNARAPRVTLDNGCHFRGNIDMRPQGDAKPAASPALGKKRLASARSAT